MVLYTEEGEVNVPTLRTVEDIYDIVMEQSYGTEIEI